jgi:hypothetical protein
MNKIIIAFGVVVMATLLIIIGVVDSIIYRFTGR